MTKRAVAREELPEDTPENYPRMVFRAGQTVNVDGADVDYLIVSSQAALADAINNGWFLCQDDAVEAGPPAETEPNPRPHEPDNAPLRNTSYANPQTGDLPDPPTSPAETPILQPAPPEDVLTPLADKKAAERDEEAKAKKRDDDRKREEEAAAKDDKKR